MVFFRDPDLDQIEPVPVLDVSPVSHYPFGPVKKFVPDYVLLLVRGTKRIKDEFRIEIKQDISHVEDYILDHLFSPFHGRSISNLFVYLNLSDCLCVIACHDGTSVAVERGYQSLELVGIITREDLVDVSGRTDIYKAAVLDTVDQYLTS